MPLPLHLDVILRQSEPNLIRLGEDDVHQLGAYLKNRDRFKRTLSQIQEEKKRGLRTHQDQSDRHEAFHRYLSAVHDYNLAIQKTDTPPAAPPPPKLTVNAWSELGIGIDETRTPRAFIPFPRFGDRVRKMDGEVLALRGERWGALFNLATMAPDGKTIVKHEFLSNLPKLRSAPKAKKVIEKSHADADGLRLVGNPDLTYLTNTLSELRGELRKLCRGPDDKAASLLQDLGSEIVLGFVVRPLLVDDTYHYTFGRPG